VAERIETSLQEETGGLGLGRRWGDPLGYSQVYKGRAGKNLSEPRRERLVSKMKSVVVQRERRLNLQLSGSILQGGSGRGGIGQR